MCSMRDGVGWQASSLATTSGPSAVSMGVSATPSRSDVLLLDIGGVRLPAPLAASDDETMSLVVAAKVPTGVMLAADSRTTTTGERAVAFDGEQKLFSFRSAPFVVGITGEVRRGQMHVTSFLREALADRPRSAKEAAAAVSGCLERAELPRARAVVGGCAEEPALWTVERDGGGWHCLEQLHRASGAVWLGTTEAFDRLVNGAHVGTLAALAAWVETVAARSLTTTERQALEQLFKPAAPDWGAVPLEEASRLLGEMLRGVVAWHRLVSGTAAPVGGPVRILSVDHWGTVRESEA